MKKRTAAQGKPPKRRVRFLLDVNGTQREPVMYGDEVVVDDRKTGSQIRGVIRKPLTK